MRKVSLLIFANKQDLPQAVATTDLAKALRLEDIKDRRVSEKTLITSGELTVNFQWYIQGCSAVSGDGLYECLDWLARDLTSQKLR